MDREAMPRLTDAENAALLATKVAITTLKKGDQFYRIREAAINDFVVMITITWEAVVAENVEFDKETRWFCKAKVVKATDKSKLNDIEFIEDYEEVVRVKS
jgi:hypothetical protein